MLLAGALSLFQVLALHCVAAKISLAHGLSWSAQTSFCSLPLHCQCHRNHPPYCCLLQTEQFACSSGGMFFCEGTCTAGTYNDGLHQCCQQCGDGLISGPQATNCTQPQLKTCPPGMGPAPACDQECQPGWYSNGFAACRKCPVGYTSGPKASNCTGPIHTTCPPGRGGLLKCDQSCRSKGMVNSGSSGDCAACPDGQRPNSNGTACTDIIHRCPPSLALGVGQEPCSDRCSEAGSYNDGSFVTCLKCPDGMTSDPGSQGATECVFRVCPAGRGPVPLCLSKCEPATFSNGTMAECTECAPGQRSYPDMGGTRCIG